jgi:hypothetical protein
MVPQFAPWTEQVVGVQLVAAEAGVSAIEMPALTCEAFRVAVFAPVGPMLVERLDADSSASRYVPWVARSHCSVIPLGGLTVGDPLAEQPKRRSEFVVVVVMDGAVHEGVAVVLACPPDAWIGWAGSTPCKA